MSTSRASPSPAQIARARVGAGDDDPSASIGSNNWAVDAARSANGFAMVADDMHLEIAVPIIWYRLRIEFTDGAGAARAVTGVSLPGTPGIVAGSNAQEPVEHYYPGDDLFTPFERRRGLPLGNLTSQFCANVYLDALDHWAT